MDLTTETIRRVNTPHRIAIMRVKVKPREATTREKETLYPFFGEMVLATITLAHSWLQLGEELTDSNALRQSVKHWYNKGEEQTAGLEQRLWKHFDDAGKKLSRELMNYQKIAYDRIQEHVAIQAPSKAYNVALSLLRIIKANNAKLGGLGWDTRNNCDVIEKALREIGDALKLEDKNLDVIVRDAIRYKEFEKAIFAKCEY